MRNMKQETLIFLIKVTVVCIHCDYRFQVVCVFLKMLTYRILLVQINHSRIQLIYMVVGILPILLVYLMLLQENIVIICPLTQQIHLSHLIVAVLRWIRSMKRSAQLEQKQILPRML